MPPEPISVLDSYKGVVLPPELSKLTNLTSIELEAAADDCLLSIAGVSGLRELQLDRPGGHLCCPHQLSNLTGLTCLRICVFWIYTESDASNLSTLKSLKALSLSLCDFGLDADQEEQLENADEYVDVHSVAVCAIGQLTQLTYLKLADWDRWAWRYGLFAEDLRELYQLTGLIRLNLSHMRMTEFQGTSKWCRLQDLDLSHNGYRSVPNVAGLTSLTALRLGFQMSGLQFADPLTFINGLPDLQLLDIRPKADQDPAWEVGSHQHIMRAMSEYASLKIEFEQD